MARILMVGSSVDDLLTITTILEREGYNVESCIDVDAGLSLIGEREPDLILLDLDSCSVLDLKKALGFPPIASLPIIVICSDNNGMGYIFCAAALWLGVRDYVLRPLDGTELVRRVHGQMQLS